MTRRKHPPRPPINETAAAVINELDQPTDPAWRHHAPCNGLDVNIFYPPRGQHTTTICHTCPHQTPCLSVAIHNGDDHGTWGSYGPTARRQITAAIRRQRPDLLPDVPATIFGTPRDAA